MPIIKIIIYNVNLNPVLENMNTLSIIILIQTIKLLETKVKYRSAVNQTAVKNSLLYVSNCNMYATINTPANVREYHVQLTYSHTMNK